MQKESMKDKVENTIVKTVDTILATMSNPESKSAAISQIIREAANDIATMMLFSSQIRSNSVNMARVQLQLARVIESPWSRS